MARLGDYIREECHPAGAQADKFHLVGVSNELGLVPSPRAAAADDLSRYQRVQRDWFAYNPMRVNVGSIGLADDGTKTGITSPDYVVFSCRDGLDPRYLLHFLKSDYGLEAIARNCSGAVRKRLYYSGLAEIELTIPDLNRQKALVSRIEHIQQAIRFIRDENSDHIELPQLKEEILQEAVSGMLTAKWRRAHPDVEPASQLFRRIQDEKARLLATKEIRSDKPLPKIAADEIPFDIPETWTWCQLGKVTRFFDYRGRTPNKIKSGVRIVTAKNVKRGHFSDEPQDFVSEEVFERHMVRGFPVNGDILFTTEAPLGNACQLNMDERFALGQRLITIQPLLSNKRFFLLAILSRTIQKQLLSKASGITAKGIKSSRLTHVLIPLPPLAEQDAIVERVDELMVKWQSLAGEVGQACSQSEDLLQAVLNEAFAKDSCLNGKGNHATSVTRKKSTAQRSRAVKSDALPLET